MEVKPISRTGASKFVPVRVNIGGFGSYSELSGFS